MLYGKCLRRYLLYPNLDISVNTIFGTFFCSSQSTKVQVMRPRSFLHLKLHCLINFFTGPYIGERPSLNTLDIFIIAPARIIMLIGY